MSKTKEKSKKQFKIPEIPVITNEEIKSDIEMCNGCHGITKDGFCDMYDCRTVLRYATSLSKQRELNEKTVDALLCIRSHVFDSINNICRNCDISTPSSMPKVVSTQFGTHEPLCFVIDIERTLFEAGVRLDDRGFRI